MNDAHGGDREKVRAVKEIAPWITEGPVLGRFWKALGPRELVKEMRAEIRAMKREYGAV